MANVSALTPLNLSNLLDSARTIKSVQKEWDRMPGDAAVGIQYFGYGPAISSLSEDFKNYYVKDQVKPRKVTLTVDPTAGAGATTITLSAFDAALFGIGTLLYFTDGEVMRVTANASSTTKTVERGFASSGTGAKNSVALRSNVYIGSPTHADEGQFQDAGTFRGDLAFSYPMLIHYTIGRSLMRSTIRTWVNKDPDELAEERARKQVEKANELEVQLWFGVEQAPTYTNPGSFKGVVGGISTNVDSAGGALTLTRIADAHQTVKRINDSGEYTLIGGYTMKRIFDALLNAKGTRQYQNMTNDVGVNWEKVILNTGPINFLTVPIFEDLAKGTLLLVKKNDIKLRPITHAHGSGWITIERPMAMTDRPRDEEVYLNMLTLEIREERQEYKFTGLDTTPGTYSGYV